MSDITLPGPTERRLFKAWAGNNVAGKKGFQSTGDHPDTDMNRHPGTESVYAPGDGGAGDLREGMAAINEARGPVIAHLKAHAAEVATVDANAARKLRQGYGGEIMSERLARLSDAVPTARSSVGGQVLILRGSGSTRKASVALLRENVAKVGEVDASAARKLRQNYSSDLSDSRIEALLYHIETGA